MAPISPLHTLLRSHLSHQIVLRAFSTTPARAISLFDLQARSVSRENGHFQQLAKGKYVDHSPALQLLQSERDLAEGTRPVEPEGILLTKQTNTEIDAQLLESYKAQNAALKAQMAGKERTWREHTQQERREWADLEEKSLRLRLMFFVSLVGMGLLAADSIALADDIEEHCPGCFTGNTTSQLFVVGYLKQATEASKRWWNNEKAGNAVKKATHKRHEIQAAPVVQTTLKTGQEGLPKGWELAQTPDGRFYYINHTDKYTTWLDPRLSQETKPIRTISSTITMANTTETTSIWHKLMWA